MVPSSHDDVIPHGDFIVGRQRLGLFPYPEERDS